MAKLVDAAVLGTAAERRGGSSPSIRTTPCDTVAPDVTRIVTLWHLPSVIAVYTHTALDLGSKPNYKLRSSENVTRNGEPPEPKRNLTNVLLSYVNPYLYGPTNVTQPETFTH